MKKFIGDKNFYKLVLAVAVPLMLQQLITSGVNLIDNLMVGQLGDSALSAVAASNKVFLIANFAIMGFMMAVAIYIAQYYGANDHEKMQHSYLFGLFFSIFISLLFMTCGFLFPREIISFFTKNEEIINLGVEYLRFANLTLLPFAISVVIGNSMRAIGAVKYPLIASVVAALTNTVLNYIFIFGNFGFAKMGVNGAALATLIARCCEMLLLIYFLLRNRFPFYSRLANIVKTEVSLIKNILIKGFPLMVNELLWTSGNAFLFMLYATRGDSVISGYSIAATTVDLFFVLFGGMSAATTVMISHRLGANKIKEAKENGYRLIGFSLFLSIFFGVLLFGSSYIVPNLFNVTEVSRGVASGVLRVMGCFFWIYMFTAECFFILRAGGDTKSTLLMDAAYMWVVNIPIVAFVAYFTNWSIMVLYICGQCTDVLKMFIAYGMIKKGRWLKNLTSEE
ncbi:MAG: MATE family efflux transporter [Erysipelotrichaceae bacterium]